MKKLLVRLKMAWLCLFGKRVLLYLPIRGKGSTSLTVCRAGPEISVYEYGAVAIFAEHMEAAAQRIAEERLMADIHAEAQRLADLEAEVAAVLKS